MKYFLQLNSDNCNGSRNKAHYLSLLLCIIETTTFILTLGYFYIIA